MAEFQSILGIVLIVTAVVIIALAIYNMALLSKANTNLTDPQSNITDGEKRGGIGTNAILILVGLVLGVFGVMLLLPAPAKSISGLSSLRGSRSMSGAVLSSSGTYV